MAVEIDALELDVWRTFVPRKWIEFGGLLPVEGHVLRVDSETIAAGGRIDGFPWGQEIWVATTEKASKWPLLVYKVFKGFLAAWTTPLGQPVYTTTDHEMSHKLVRRLGFRVVEEGVEGSVRWEYVRR